MILFIQMLTVWTLFRSVVRIGSVQKSVHAQDPLLTVETMASQKYQTFYLQMLLNCKFIYDNMAEYMIA